MLMRADRVCQGSAGLISRGCLVAPAIVVTNQCIDLQQIDTEAPCYKGNKHTTHPFGFPTSLGLDRLWETHVVIP